MLRLFNLLVRNTCILHNYSLLRLSSLSMILYEIQLVIFYSDVEGVPSYAKNAYILADLAINWKHCFPSEITFRFELLLQTNSSHVPSKIEIINYCKMAPVFILMLSSASRHFVNKLIVKCRC